MKRFLAAFLLTLSFSSLANTDYGTVECRYSSFVNNSVTWTHPLMDADHNGGLEWYDLPATGKANTFTYTSPEGFIFKLNLSNKNFHKKPRVDRSTSITYKNVSTDLVVDYERDADINRDVRLTLKVNENGKELSAHLSCSLSRL